LGVNDWGRGNGGSGIFAAPLVVPA
jgi:hypothetical protein